MFSLNEWVVKGKVMEVTEKPKGFWVAVKGVAENPSLFNSDAFRINCWITKKVLGQRKIRNEITLKGKFRFKNNNCCFITDTVL